MQKAKKIAPGPFRYRVLEGAVVLLTFMTVPVHESGAQNPTTQSAGTFRTVTHQSVDGAREFLILSSNPALTIGQQTEDPRYKFARDITAIRLQDGRIAAASRMDRSFRIFDAAGTHLRTVSPLADGRGGLTIIQDICALRNDSLIVVHFASASTISVFSADGVLSRRLRTG